MDITLHRRWLIAGLGLAAALAAALIFGPQLLKPAVSAPLPPDQAAAGFLRAFYTVDYRDRAGWLASLRPLAMDSGYTLIENMLAPTTWPALTQGQIMTLAEHVQVMDEGLRAEGAGETKPGSERSGGSWQIRRLTVTIAEAGRWPGMTAEPFAANVLLVEDEGAWKFGAFLSDADVQVFSRKGGQP